MMSTKLGSLSVSRETIDRLTQYAELVQKWSPRINLVSKSSLEHLWDRHIIDSAQLFTLAETQYSWVDLGSGGGFPALVIAILSADQGIDRRITMVESDTRKGVFLKTVIRELELPATVLTSRIENTKPVNADVLSARALSDLSRLLTFADRHMSPTGIALFPKGETWEKEVAKAKEQWSFNLEEFTSWTEPKAAILKIRGLTRV
ncbi:MAG: 16S rRNA (guanine(527)-N(7))-methyltransferase RsmG [Arenibacterium sp.]